MGIETIAIAALVGGAAAKITGTILENRAEQKQAEAEARAAVATADVESERKVKQVQVKTARAKVSFINSGLTLEGTPAAAISGILESGIEDLELLRSNVDIQVSNRMERARTKALANLLNTAGEITQSFAMSAATGGMGGGAPGTGGEFAAQRSPEGVPIPVRKPSFAIPQ
ncbi:MAG: hypothetical protein V3U75_13335 [Methylococcaceae bacterium]